MSRAGEVRGRGGLGGQARGEVEWTESALSTPPLTSWNGAFRAHFSRGFQQTSDPELGF